jgi:hypothetical protein
MLVKESKEYANISTGNTKMPGTTFAIDAFACITGSKLAKIEGTPCFNCYARKLQKIRPSVDQGWKANLSKWDKANKSKWIAATVFQIKRYNVDGYHRWFDSGDLQSVEMLSNIVDVALLTPEIKHWLPTQERGIVNDYIKEYGKVPTNLLIRVSASKVDTDNVPNFEHTSMVFTKNGSPIGKECRAYCTDKNNKVWNKKEFNELSRQDKKSLDFGHCGPCRACWDKSVPTTSYPIHK